MKKIIAFFPLILNFVLVNTHAQDIKTPPMRVLKPYICDGEFNNYCKGYSRAEIYKDEIKMEVCDFMFDESLVKKGYNDLNKFKGHGLKFQIDEDRWDDPIRNTDRFYERQSFFIDNIVNLGNKEISAKVSLRIDYELKNAIYIEIYNPLGRGWIFKTKNFEDALRCHVGDISELKFFEN